MIRGLLIFLFIPFLGNAQTIEPGKLGPALISALQQDYTPTNPMGYGPARDILYSEIDNEGLELSGIYTNFTVTLDPNADPSQSAFQDGAGINAEHVYPQSKGASDEPQRSDVHNIFPSKVNVNSDRGSCKFGDIEDSDTESWYYLSMQLSSIPSANIDNYSERDTEDCVFEPRESVKGNIARAMFYFYTIYQSVANNADPNYFDSQKETLLQWHLDDPVDAKERERDSLIQLQQGNNNPFILDATLAERAYFETTAVEDLKKQNWVTISNNLVQSNLTVFSQEENGEVLLYNTVGQVIRRFSLNNEVELNLQDLRSGSYLILVRTENLAKTFRIVKY